MIALDEDYLRTCERLSTSVHHIPGLYATGDTWKTPDWNFFAQSLTQELAKMHAYQAFLWKDRYLYEYGYRLLSPSKIEEKITDLKRVVFQEYPPQKLVATGDFSYSGWEFTTYSSIHSVQRSGIVFIVILKKKSHPSAQQWQRLSQLLDSFGYALDPPQSQILSLFSDFSQDFLGRVSEDLRESKHGVITHFYIQNLEPYFEAMGMQKSFEILKSIQQVFESHMKRGDIFVHQVPRSFFVYSPGCKAETILERYEQVFLQIQHLIIDYRMRFLELDSYEGLAHRWQEFLSEDLDR